MRNQNQDGGWGYGHGQSWTEPTCYAVLAMQAMGLENSQAASRAKDWIRARQRDDGGWAPQDAVNQSTWVTSLASLTLAGDKTQDESWGRSIAWLEHQIGRPSDSVDRLRQQLFGDAATRSDPPGFSWVPGTASWITPTVTGIVALSKVAAMNGRLARRMEEARQFIISRQCADGGWNHGGSSFRSENATSYAETTGMALIGLQGVSSANRDRWLTRAEALASQAGSSEATSWLQIGLTLQARVPSMENTHPCRTNYDRSLRLLAIAAAEGTSVFSTVSA